MITTHDNLYGMKADAHGAAGWLRVARLIGGQAPSRAIRGVSRQDMVNI